MLCSGRRETENHWARFICRFKIKKIRPGASRRRFDKFGENLERGAELHFARLDPSELEIQKSIVSFECLIWIYPAGGFFYFLSLIRFLHRSRLKPSNVLWFECNWPLLLLPSNQIQSKSWGLLGGKDTGASWKRRCHRIPALIFQQNVSWLATGKSKTSENRSLGAPLFFKKKKREKVFHFW